jgi:hypothetical protein
MDSLYTNTARGCREATAHPQPGDGASGSPALIRAYRPSDPPFSAGGRGRADNPGRSSPTLREWLHIFSELLTVLGGLAVLGLLMVMA